jgi:hypothetical protein
VIASFQWLCPCHHAALLRTHEDGGKLGDPYTWAVTVSVRYERPWWVWWWRGRPVAEFVGVHTRRPTMEEYRAVRAALRAAGFILDWNRKGGAKPGRHRHDL